MTNEIAVQSAGSALEMNVQERQQYASVLADANMIPKAFQKSPANIFVAIEYGNALGIAPIVALNEINVINGTPSLSASMMSSLARSAGHRVRTQNTEDGAAVCEIIRADDPEFTHRSTWDQKKAQDAGLWGKGHWAKDPATMLRWRAISECVRMACPEVLGGLKYTPEETIEFTGSPAPRRQAAPAQQQAQPEEDFYALLDQCQSRDDLNQVAGKISAAGRMNEYRGTLNELWKTFTPEPEAQDEEVVDGTLVDDDGVVQDNAA